ncbi:MAG: glycosyltransferase family 2 protein [Hyphomonadaceae bacterium]
MRIALVIATLGRVDVLAKTLPVWAAQSKLYDRLVISATCEADIGGSAKLAPAAETIFGPKGLCAQRNRALDLLAGDCEIVAFVDDDYVPCRTFIENAFDVFVRAPDAVAATGLVLADGITKGGIPFEKALAITAAHDAKAEPENPEILPARHSYGCNMVLRMSAAPDLRFDERLPLYGWQEDLDFSRRLGAYGAIVWSRAFAGVHMGSTSGRQAGLRLGYSQVANPFYLAAKGPMTWREATIMASRNMIANTVKSFAPEPWVDRRGRLAGNALALADALRRRLRPERILEL